MIWHKAARYFMKVKWLSFVELAQVVEMGSAKWVYEVFINPILILGVGMDL